MGALGGGDLTISGVSEGARLQMPPGAASMQLTVQATTGKPDDPGEIEFVLEWQGVAKPARSAPMGSPITFDSLHPGKYFLTARSTGAVADVSFDVSPASVRPGNDAWTNATPVAGTAPFHGSNLNATRDPGEPALSSNQAGRTVWWSWVAPATGWATVTTRGSAFDTVLGVYTGTGLTNLQSVGWNDDAGFETHSQVTFRQAANITYYFVVDGVISDLAAPSAGAIQLQVVEGQPPGISLPGPIDGSTHFVPGESSTTNLTMTAAIGGGTGLLEVVSLLENEAGFRRSGAHQPPYQWVETNLPAGEYGWVVSATDSRGLVGITRAGFSVVSLRPGIALGELLPGPVKSIPLIVRGFPGRPLRLESSSDLAHWTSEWSWVSFPGIEQVVDAHPLASGIKAYRAVAP